MDDEQRLAHIREAMAEIEAYLSVAHRAVFLNNSMMRFATIKQLEIMGEAAKSVTPETRERYPQVPWQQIAGLRNVLVHEYLGVDVHLIWEIATLDIPELKKALF
ncbi:MAG: DUF86 domain-containing protein [Cyclobacteriaceae bacterium]|jgi:uncharacterized protein with HEPN domain|nr:DUF86 domain-containing protein [Cyclobacteriaceae bacterium]